jgi:hypothetical protein
MRTLVVSDLHLGMVSGGDLLRREDVRDRLAEALAGIERLVLLGDTLELRQGPLREAVAAAAPVFEALGQALGSDGELLLTCGNHDHALLNGWLARRAAAGPPPPLGLDSEVDWFEHEPLGLLAAALAPARLRVAYPGAWLAPGVYAMHGHYLDADTALPTFERIGAGAMARLLRRSLPDRAVAEDYEALLAPLYAWLHANAQWANGRARLQSGTTTLRAWGALRRDGGARGLRARALRGSFALTVALLERMGLGPLQARLDAAALRDCSLAAFDRVLVRLAVGARTVIFGHTHRAGPLPGDAPALWQTAGGGRLLNTGSWVHEPSFLGADPRRSPYRPGFAVRLDEGRDPELVNLLDGPGPG